MTELQMKVDNEKKLRDKYVMKLRKETQEWMEQVGGNGGCCTGFLLGMYCVAGAYCQLGISRSLNFLHAVCLVLDTGAWHAASHPLGPMSCVILKRCSSVRVRIRSYGSLFSLRYALALSSSSLFRCCKQVHDLHEYIKEIKSQLSDTQLGNTPPPSAPAAAGAHDGSNGTALELLASPYTPTLAIDSAEKLSGATIRHRARSVLDSYKRDQQSPAVTPELNGQAVTRDASQPPASAEADARPLFDGSALTFSPHPAPGQQPSTSTSHVTPGLTHELAKLSRLGPSGGGTRLAPPAVKEHVNQRAVQGLVTLSPPVLEHNGSSGRYNGSSSAGRYNQHPRHQQDTPPGRLGAGDSSTSDGDTGGCTPASEARSQSEENAQKLREFREGLAQLAESPKRENELMLQQLWQGIEKLTSPAGSPI